MKQLYTLMFFLLAAGFTARSQPVFTQDNVYFKVDCNFHDRSGKRYFYYSPDGKSWKKIGAVLQMSYTIPHFMGYRFGLFNYATQQTGGYVDVDFFNTLSGSSPGKSPDSPH